LFASRPPPAVKRKRLQVWTCSPFNRI